MTFREQLRSNKRTMKYAALVGAVLALTCQLVPPQYRAVCDIVTALCML